VSASISPARPHHSDREKSRSKEKPDNSAIIQPIADDLTTEQIKAVAAYVSQLE
jgi:hypothetical protein